MARSNFFQTSSNSLTPKIGSRIIDVVDEAIKIAEQRNCEISFEIHDVTIVVNGESNPWLIFRDVQRALHGYIEKSVGPAPNLIRSRQEQQSDARIETENQRKRSQRAREYAEKTQQRRQEIEERLKHAPEMKFSNSSVWIAAQAAYQHDIRMADILPYAQRWARIMQLEIREGKLLRDIWESTSYEVDFENIFGPCQVIAGQLLVQCWVHGVELGKLYNRE